MAQVINGHWTNDSAKAFLFRIAFDFVAQLERMMEAKNLSPSGLAKRLNVSKGRVSQIMNNPGNLTLRTIVEWARALDVKVAVIAYDDDDPSNDNGPVNPQIFATCWERAGKPTDFFAARMAVASTNTVEIAAKWARQNSVRVSQAELGQEMAETMGGMGGIEPMWQRLDDSGEVSYAGTDSDYL